MFRSVCCSMLVVICFVVAAGDGMGQTRLRASYGSLAVSQVILPLGVRAGIFQRNGLNLEPIYIGGRSVSALINGDVQFGFMGGPPAILARVSGGDVVMLAGLSMGSTRFSLPYPRSSAAQISSANGSASAASARRRITALLFSH